MILAFIAGSSLEAFQDDEKTRSAVLYQLLVIGEATKRLSGEFRNAHSAIKWTSIAGMRDHLIHAYDSVDWEEVWNTATKDVPHLLAYLRALDGPVGGANAQVQQY